MKSLKTKKPNLVKMLWSSDQHNLHTNTPTTHILSNLSYFYFTAFDLSEIDICVLGGDFFDRLVDASNEDMRRAEYWIKKFLTRCHQHNVIVRVLEGTSSHDREQPEIFEVQKPEGLDLKWVKTLSTEYFPTLDFTCLYVPDNMGTKTPDEIWEDTLTVLSKDGLTAVDYVFFHGAFKYQLPPVIAHKSHDEQQWSKIAKQFILAGHVHIPSEYLNIRVSGSFDRLCHGEDHPKGAYYVEFDLKERKSKAVFWENKRAMPYVTLTIKPEEDIAAVIERLNHLLKDPELTLYGNVRIKGGDPLVVNPVIEQYSESYPHIRFTAKNIKKEDILLEEDIYTEQTYTGTTLNKDNIQDALIDRLLEKQLASNDEIEDYKALIGEFIT